MYLPLKEKEKIVFYSLSIEDDFAKRFIDVVKEMNDFRADDELKQIYDLTEKIADKYWERLCLCLHNPAEAIIILKDLICNEFDAKNLSDLENKNPDFYYFMCLLDSKFVRIEKLDEDDGIYRFVDESSLLEDIAIDNYECINYMMNFGLDFKKISFNSKIYKKSKSQ